MIRNTWQVRPGRRAGFSLLEVTVSTLLVGILLTGSLSTVAALIARHGRRAQDDVKGALAHDLMSEIQQADFEDGDAASPAWGPEPGEGTSTREAFDDVDDYDGWTETTIQRKDGSALPGYAGYRRTVVVQPVSVVDPTANSPVATDLNRITVTVTAPDGRQASLSALRSRHSPFDVPPGVRSTYVRAVGLRLELEDASSSVGSATSVLNQMPVEEAP